MPVEIRLICSGCATAPVTIGYMRHKFARLGNTNFGRWRTVLPDAPTGWTMFDPYTQCTYCPVCSEELFGPPVNQDAAAEIPASYDHFAVVR